jgi:hypothetical protein
MKKILFVVALIIAYLFMPAGAEMHAQYTPPDSCLKLLYSNNIDIFNRDSLKVDSCEGSITFGQLYAKRYFGLTFEYNIIPRNYKMDHDSLVEYTWHNINLNYPEAIVGFHGLEDKFGQFYFREQTTQTADTNQYYKRYLLVYFNNYVNVDSVLIFIRNIALVKEVISILNYDTLCKVPNDLTKENIFHLYPNPASNIIVLFTDVDVINKSANQIFIYNEINQLVKIVDLNTIQLPKIIINISDIPFGFYYIYYINHCIPFIKKY